MGEFIRIDGAFTKDEVEGIVRELNSARNTRIQRRWHERYSTHSRGSERGGLSGVGCRRQGVW